MSREAVDPVPTAYAERSLLKEVTISGCIVAPSTTARASGGQGRRLDWIKPYTQGKRRVLRRLSPEALAGRMDDGKSRIAITANAGKPGGRPVVLKENGVRAVALCRETSMDREVVVNYTDDEVPWNSARDCDYGELVAQQSDDCEAEEMNAEDPLFILYTSGSTGKLKGVLHTSGGYLTYTSLTHEYVFDSDAASAHARSGQ